MAKKPQPPVKEGANDAQSFKTLFNVVVGGETIPPGGQIDLTREEFDTLKPLGAIEGEWK